MRRTVLCMSACFQLACHPAAPTAQPRAEGAIASSISTSASPTSHHRTERLSWLIGRWFAQTPDGVVTETWNLAEGGVLIGRGETRKGDAVVFFEHMRVEFDGDGVATFFASPMGRTPATPFRQRTLSDAAFVVENPDNEFPQRITYRRDGDTLTATIEGGGESTRWLFRHRE